jgi:hypothetical protein
MLNTADQQQLDRYLILVRGGATKICAAGRPKR